MSLMPRIQAPNMVLRRTIPSSDDYRQNNATLDILRTQFWLNRIAGYDTVGLAANNIGISVRAMVVIEEDDETLVEFINPYIVRYGYYTTTQPEACGSLDGVRVNVERSLDVLVQYNDREGHQIYREFHEYTARVVQHEIDHLNGILIIDRNLLDVSRLRCL